MEEIKNLRQTTQPCTEVWFPNEEPNDHLLLVRSKESEEWSGRVPVDQLENFEDIQIVELIDHLIQETKDEKENFIMNVLSKQKKKTRQPTTRKVSFNKRLQNRYDRIKKKIIDLHLLGKSPSQIASDCKRSAASVRSLIAEYEAGLELLNPVKKRWMDDIRLIKGELQKK